MKKNYKFRYARGIGFLKHIFYLIFQVPIIFLEKIFFYLYDVEKVDLNLLFSFNITHANELHHTIYTEILTEKWIFILFGKLKVHIADIIMLKKDIKNLDFFFWQNDA